MRITTAVQSLAGLAQETRLRIFRLLVRQGPAGLSAGLIAKRLKAPPATLFEATAPPSSGTCITP